MNTVKTTLLQLHIIDVSFIFVRFLSAPKPDKPDQNQKLKASLAEHAEYAEFKQKPESLSWRIIF